MFSRENKGGRRTLREQTSCPEDLTEVFPQEEEVEMEEQKPQTQKMSGSNVDEEPCSGALCDQGGGNGSSRPSTVPGKLGATSEINVVDEDDDEDLQLALALSASLAESKTESIPPVSRSNEKRKGSEILRSSRQSSEKGEDPQKQEVLLIDVPRSSRNSSRTSVDTLVSLECDRKSSTSSSVHGIAGVRKGRARPSKNGRSGSVTSESLCSKLKERRLRSKCHRASISSPGDGDSGPPKVQTLNMDCSRGDVHNSSDSGSSHVCSTSSLQAVGDSLASSSRNATSEGAVPTSDFVPSPSEGTSHKEVSVAHSVAPFREERPEDDVSYYRLPCSASLVGILSSDIAGNDADGDDTICRNAFGERRRERRERRRGRSSLDDDADVMEEEEDVEQVFSEARTRGRLLGTADITGRRVSPEAQQTDPGVHIAFPTTSCNFSFYPNMDAVVSKRECTGSDSIMNSSSSSSSFIPGSNARDSVGCRRGSSSSSRSTTENSSSCGVNKRRCNAGGDNLCSDDITGRSSSFPYSGEDTCKGKLHRKVAKQEGRKRPTCETGGFFHLEQQQRPQQEFNVPTTREADASFEGKVGETTPAACESSRCSALIQQQQWGLQEEGSLDTGEQQREVQQKSLLSSTTLANDPAIGAGKSVTVDEGGGIQEKAVKRRRHHHREVNSEGKRQRKTVDKANAKRRRKRRKTSSDEDTEEEEDEDDVALNYEEDSTLSDETTTMIPDTDEGDDEETQLQVALAVSLSTVEQKKPSICQASAMLTPMSPTSSSSSSSSTRVPGSGVACDNSNKNPKLETKSSGSNKYRTSCNGSTSRGGVGHSSSERIKRRNDNCSADADVGCSSSIDAQALPDQNSHCVNRDGEQKDSCARVDKSCIDYEGSSGCGHSHPSREKGCRQENRGNEKNPDHIPQNAETADCSSEMEIPRSPVMEAAASFIGCAFGAGVTPAATVPMADKEHAALLSVAGSESDTGSVRDTKIEPAPSVAAVKALEESSLVNVTVRGAQTGGVTSAARSRTAIIPQVTGAGQRRGTTACETEAARAGMATAGTIATARTTPAGSPAGVAEGIISSRKTCRTVATAAPDAGIMQWEEVGFSTDSEEDHVKDDNSSDSDFELERRKKGNKKKKKKKKKEEVRQSVQGQEEQDEQRGLAKRSALDSEHSIDKTSSSSEMSSADEEGEHDGTEDSEEDGGLMGQTHRKMRRERQVQTGSQQQHQTGSFRQVHQQQRRKPRRVCKSSEDGKDDRRRRGATRSDVQCRLSSETNEEGERGAEGQQVSVQCHMEVADAETAAAGESLSDSATPNSAKTDSDVCNAHVTVPQLTSGLVGVSSSSFPAVKSSRVTARVKGRVLTAASRIGERASAASLQDDGVQDKAVKGRQRRSCIAGGISMKTEHEKKGRKTRSLARQDRQNEKQERRCVSNAAATAAVKMWKHEKLHEVCLYIWAAITEAISVPCKSEAVPRDDARRPGKTERLIRAIADQHCRQEQRAQQQLEQILCEQQQQQQQLDLGNTPERHAAGDTNVCEQATSDRSTDRHPPQQQELFRREQQDTQSCATEGGRGQQQEVQHLPPPRPFLTLEQLGKVAEMVGLAGLTVDELMKMVATAAGAAQAAREQQQQQPMHGTGQLPEKKGRNSKQGGYLSSDACGQHYSQALGRTTLSFEEFVAFFHYGLGLRVESNGKVW